MKSSKYIAFKNVQNNVNNMPTYVRFFFNGEEIHVYLQVQRLSTETHKTTCKGTGAETIYKDTYLLGNSGRFWVCAMRRVILHHILFCT